MIGRATMLALAALTLSGAQAQQHEATYFGQAGYWQVFAVSDATGTFDQCLATVEYNSGQRLSLTLNVQDKWRLQVHRPDWPRRQLPEVDANLTIDGKHYAAQKAALMGRSLFVELTETTRTALAAGRNVAIATRLVQVDLRLNGPALAMQRTAACHRAHGPG